MEFILQTQAKVEATLDRMAERQGRMAEQQGDHQRRIAEHDQKMALLDERIRRLVRLGVQEARAERRRWREMALEWEARSKASDERIDRLGAKIDAFIESIRGRTNGHS